MVVCLAFPARVVGVRNEVVNVGIIVLDRPTTTHTAGATSFTATFSTRRPWPVGRGSDSQRDAPNKKGYGSNTSSNPEMTNKISHTPRAIRDTARAKPPLGRVGVEGAPSGACDGPSTRAPGSRVRRSERLDGRHRRRTRAPPRRSPFGDRRGIPLALGWCSRRGLAGAQLAWWSPADSDRLWRPNPRRGSVVVVVQRIPSTHVSIRKRVAWHHRRAPGAWCSRSSTSAWRALSRRSSPPRTSPCSAPTRATSRVRTPRWQRILRRHSFSQSSARVVVPRRRAPGFRARSSRRVRFYRSFHTRTINMYRTHV